jgi:hypothetical protein
MYISQYAPSDSELASLIATQMFHIPIKCVHSIVEDAGYTSVPTNKIIFMGTFCAAQEELMELVDIKVAKYTVLSCGDGRVCEKCKKMDGKSFSVTKAVVGKNLPPFCDSCRCLIVAKFKY